MCQDDSLVREINRHAGFNTDWWVHQERQLIIIIAGTSLVAKMVKRLPTMRETQGQSLGQEDPLEKEMANHSSILSWKIPWKDEPGSLQSIGTRMNDFTFFLL